MELGLSSFILEAYYGWEWADIFVAHVTVSDVDLWRDHIVDIDLPALRRQDPSTELQGWTVVGGMTDPFEVF